MKQKDLRNLKNTQGMKVGELKGTRKLQRIECSCSGIAIWIAHGNKKFDAKERRKFIEAHKDPNLTTFQVTSKVFEGHVKL